MRWALHADNLMLGLACIQNFETDPKHNMPGDHSQVDGVVPGSADVAVLDPEVFALVDLERLLGRLRRGRCARESNSPQQDAIARVKVQNVAAAA